MSSPDIALQPISNLNYGFIALSEAFAGESINLDETQEEEAVGVSKTNETVQQIASNTLKTIFEKDATRAKQIQELENSSKICSLCRTGGAIFTGASPILGYFCDALVQILQKDEKDGTEEDAYWGTQLGIIIVAGTACVISAITSVIFQFTLSRKESKRKDLLKLTEHDKGALVKLTTVLEGIGQLWKLRKEKEEEKEEEKTNLEPLITDLFENLKGLPKKLDDKPLPSAELLASVIIDNLPEDHPIRKSLRNIAIQERIVEESDSDSDDFGMRNRSFENKGQKNARGSQLLEPGDVLNYKSPEKVLESEWGTLKQYMGGLYVSHLLFTRDEDNEVIQLDNAFNTYQDIDFFNPERVSEEV